MDSLGHSHVVPGTLITFLQKHSENRRVFVLFFLLVDKELYFNARNTCQHLTMAPRADDADMARSEVGLPMRPLQNLSLKIGGLKKELKCAEKEKKKPTHNNPKKCFIICLKAKIKYPLSGTQSSACFWQESSILTHAYHFPWSLGEPIGDLQNHRALATSLKAQLYTRRHQQRVPACTCRGT